MLKNQREGVGDAQKYIAWAENSFTWKYIERPSFIRNLKKDLNQETKVIDAGCGAGRTINFLVRYKIQEKNIIGVDTDSDLLAYCNQRFPKVQLIHNSISENLQIKDVSTDLVTCHNVLHYLDNKQFARALRNFYLWLKNDGILFIVTPHPVHMSDVIYKNMSDYFNRDKKIVKTRWGEQAPYYHRIMSDYINQLVTSGFQIEKIEEPEIVKEGKVDNLQYNHYSRTPARLSIKAKK